MSVWNIAVTAICAWRENRAGGLNGMQSVINVLQNRAKASGLTMADEALKKWQFSSMTAPGDPQLSLGPNFTDTHDEMAYRTALRLAAEADSDNLPDITGGAVNYYAVSMTTPPSWAGSMDRTTEIQGQIFFRSRQV